MRPASSALGAIAATTLLMLLAACGSLPGAAQTPNAPPDPPTAVSSAPGGGDRSTGEGTPSTDPGDGPSSTDPGGGTSGTGTGDASCPADIVARICADVNLTGAATVSGRGIVTAPIPPGSDPSTTCAAIAADDGGGNLGDHLDTVDGHQLAWDTSITNFHGPGTYSGSELHLTIDDDAYSASGGGTVAITVGADFATTIRMTDLLSSGDSRDRVSGTIAWTCVDPTTGGQ